MKKLVFLVIMILLGSSWVAIAGEDLETVANFEEGSSFYDMTYGAKIIAGAQGTNNINTVEKYKPGYTEQELKNIELAAADISGGSVTTGLAGMQRAVGEAMLGSSIGEVPREAITALPSFPWEFYISDAGTAIPHPSFRQLALTMYNQAVANVPTQMTQTDPKLRQAPLIEFNYLVVQTQAEVQRMCPSCQWNSIATAITDKINMTYHPMTQYYYWPPQITRDVIQYNYDNVYKPAWNAVKTTYEDQLWYPNYNYSNMASINQVYNTYLQYSTDPHVMGQMEYYADHNAQNQAHLQQDAQAYIQKHPMDSASNY